MAGSFQLGKGGGGGAALLPRGTNLPQQGEAATGEPGQSSRLVRGPGHNHLVAGRTADLHGVLQEDEWPRDVNGVEGHWRERERWEVLGCPS